MKRFYCLLAMVVSISYPAHAATVEVITNGGFEAGNTGFTSDFIDLSPGLAFDPGTRSTTDPVTNYFGVDAYEGDWMLAAVTTGQPAAELSIWEQVVWLEAGVPYYDFSMYIANTEAGGAPVQLSNRFNGVEFSIFSSSLVEDQWAGLFSNFANVTNGIPHNFNRRCIRPALYSFRCRQYLVDLRYAGRASSLAGWWNSVFDGFVRTRGPAATINLDQT